MDKLVARFADGEVAKGCAVDFSMAEDLFHLLDGTAEVPDTSMAIHTRDLKAVFGVRDFAGNPRHIESNEFDSPEPPPGAVRVVFGDGEVLVGTSAGLAPASPGFFLIPADSESNNVWCYVVTAATREVCFL